MPAIEFKRGKRYLIGLGGGAAQGAVAEFVRKQRGSNGKLVFKIMPHGEEIVLQAGTFQYHKSAVQKKTNKQGSRMLLFMCIMCGWKGRATGYWLTQAVPACPMPKNLCSDSGKPMDVTWE